MCRKCELLLHLSNDTFLENKNGDRRTLSNPMNDKFYFYYNCNVSTAGMYKSKGLVYQSIPPFLFPPKKDMKGKVTKILLLCCRMLICKICMDAGGQLV